MSSSRKQPRPRRSFTSEFKAEIVERCRAGDRSVEQVACDFDLSETAVREWVRAAERDEADGGGPAGASGGLSSTEATFPGAFAAVVAHLSAMGCSGRRQHSRSLAAQLGS